MASHPASVDEYMEKVPSDDARACLARLRAIIREVAPEAQEVISYGIPTYKHQGFLASFAAFKNHCSFFPGHTVADFTDRLGGFKIRKGTIQFTSANPIPEDLVRQIIRARMAENRAR